MGEEGEKTYHMTPDEFRRWGAEAVEWVARYMEKVEEFPVLSRSAPGDIRRDNGLSLHVPVPRFTDQRKRARNRGAIRARFQRIHRAASRRAGGPLPHQFQQLVEFQYVLCRA